MAKTRLTKTIYVYEETDRDKDTFLMAGNDVEYCSEVGETRLVGVYELKKKIKVSAKPVIEVVDVK